MSMLSSFLKKLFANQLNVDDRQPILSFQTSSTFIPLSFLSNTSTQTKKIFLNDDNDNYRPPPFVTWELLPPNLELWNQLIVLLIIQTVFQTIFAILIYTTIVKCRGSKLSYVIGWCIFIPAALLLPYELLEYIHVENTVIRMAFGSPALIIVFRCIEAMYNTSPPYVEYNVGTYCLYYSTLLHFVWYSDSADIKGHSPPPPMRQKIQLSDLWSKAAKVLQLFILLSIASSVMLQSNFYPFSSSKVVITDYHLWNPFDLLSPAHLGNAYMAAILIFLTLNYGFTLTALGDEAKGLVYTKPSFYDPLYSSHSPSDFWARRWNLMIHRILKHGCFLPVKNSIGSNSILHRYATAIAIATTYLVSGLFHEYSNSIIFYHYRDSRSPETGICESCYLYRYGKLLTFFAWNGIVMLVERPFCTHIFKGKLRNSLPLPVLSTLVVLTALPVAHWYYGDWVAGQYFYHISIGLWRLRIK